MVLRAEIVVVEKMLVEFGTEVMLPVDPDKAVPLRDHGDIDRSADRFGRERHTLLEPVQAHKPRSRVADLILRHIGDRLVNRTEMLLLAHRWPSRKGWC